MLPVQGSDTNWYKNLLVNPTLKISVNGIESAARGKLLTYSNNVDNIAKKFKSKYGEGATTTLMNLRLGIAYSIMRSIFRYYIRSPTISSK